MARHSWTWAAALTALCALGAEARADTVAVDDLGAGGWILGDTRAYLPAGAPTTVQLNWAPPSEGNVNLTAERVTFTAVDDPLPTATASLRLRTASYNQEKATIENRDLVGRPLAAGIGNTSLAITYSWLRDLGGVAAPAIKLGIDTGEANPLSTANGGLTGQRGEDRFDKILVYEPYLQPGGRMSGRWYTETVTSSQGEFWLVNLTAGSSIQATSQAVTHTLAEWAAIFAGSASAGVGTIVSLQIGIGSANPGLDTFVDWLAYADGAGEGRRWEFGRPSSNARIASATTSGVVAAGASVTLEGSGTSPDGAPLPGESLEWSSDIDGPIATGGHVVTQGLRPGIHTISLVATDAEGRRSPPAQTEIAISSELAATQSALAAARSGLSDAQFDIGEIRRLLTLRPARRARQPNLGRTPEGRAAIAKLIDG